jgi:general secretion pathway protein K
MNHPRAIHRAQRGAALLMAMVTVTLVATLASGMVWQQWRAIQVEAAERSRAQSEWVLLGALDWSRLILREDARSGAVDHLGEPWATPLAEARLSTFLAADSDNNADGGPEAFLSGSIADAQSRYNLRNLVGNDGKLVAAEVQTLVRLCAAANLPSDLATRLADALVQNWAAKAAADDTAVRTLPIQRIDQLAWLGFEPGVVDALRPFVDVLPATPVNVNTASREVIAAVLDIDLGSAERLVQTRQRSPVDSPEKLKAYLPQGRTPEASRAGFASSFFEVRGRLRLDERMLEERSLMQRRGGGGTTEVVALRRERRTLPTQGP